MTEVALKPEVTAILERLRRGQRWLAKTYDDLYRLPDAGYGSERERQFNRGIHEWGRLEIALRDVHGYTGCCIWGPGGRCLENSPLICDHCGEIEPLMG